MAIPFSLRVISETPRFASAFSFSRAFLKVSSFSISIPEANCASFLLGVKRYAPLYFEKSLPFGSTKTFLLYLFA